MNIAASIASSRAMLDFGYGLIRYWLTIYAQIIDETETIQNFTDPGIPGTVSRINWNNKTKI